jgi:excisionase family DNA binding protein
MPIYAKSGQNDHQQIGHLMIEPLDEILTIEEVAAYLKAGRRTVYRLAANGQIPAFKLGGTWRFQRAELDRWIAARIGTPEGKPKPEEEKP